MIFYPVTLISLKLFFCTQKTTKEKLYIKSPSGYCFINLFHFKDTLLRRKQGIIRQICQKLDCLYSFACENIFFHAMFQPNFFNSVLVKFNVWDRENLSLYNIPHFFTTYLTRLYVKDNCLVSLSNQFML